jgi:hypothetical protein
LKYAHVIHDEQMNAFKGTDIIEYQILVGVAQPIRTPPYRTPYALRGEMKAQKRDVQRKVVIRQGKSPCFASANLVPKRARREVKI